MTDVAARPLSISDPEFWWRPLADRMADFAEMRADGPFTRAEITHPLTGEQEAFYAVTRFDEVVEISRRPQVFCSGRGSTSILDMPAEALEFFGSFITMDDPATPASAASSPGSSRPAGSRPSSTRSRGSAPS